MTFDQEEDVQDESWFIRKHACVTSDALAADHPQLERRKLSLPRSTQYSLLRNEKEAVRTSPIGGGLPPQAVDVTRVNELKRRRSAEVEIQRALALML